VDEQVREVAWSAEVGKADWIAERLHPFAHDVGSVIPDCFDSYIRVLHPATGWTAQGQAKVRWAQIGEWNARTMHPEVQFHSIASPADGSKGRHTGIRRLPTAASSEMRRAGWSRCWLSTRPPSIGAGFACGAGYGWGRAAPLVRGLWRQTRYLPDPIPRSVRDWPRVELAGRDYFQYSGPITDALAFVATKHQTRNLWWPQDRAWCVASEIDLCWTYVGGTRAMADQLLCDPRLETRPAMPTEHFTYDSDRING
jgi:hypothetical protein